MTPERLQEIEEELREAYEREVWKWGDAHYLRQMIEAASSYRRGVRLRRQDAIKSQERCERRAKESAPELL